MVRRNVANFEKSLTNRHCHHLNRIGPDKRASRQLGIWQIPHDDKRTYQDLGLMPNCAVSRLKYVLHSIKNALGRRHSCSSVIRKMQKACDLAAAQI